MTASFVDEFSRQARAYGRYRPRYPATLFDFLVGLCPGREAAWDVGTGSGQCALALAERFAWVHASDPSEAQLDERVACDNVRYFVGTAEESTLPSASVDLVTVAQAAHWFDWARFGPEVHRVLRPGGVVACFGYAFHRSDEPELDRVLEHFGREELGPYWSPQVRVLWDDYRALPFPFAEVVAPPFSLDVDWDLETLLGYLSTWSSVQKYRAATGRDPIEALRPALIGPWGEPTSPRRLRSPLALRVGVNAPGG